MAITVLDDWSFVDDSTPDGQSLAVSAGSNRVMVMFYGSPSHDIDFFGWTVTSSPWGDQAPTATYKFGDGTDNSPRFFALWDETAVAARADDIVDWTATDISNEFFGWACYAGVKQTGLDALVNDATNYGDNQSTSTLTTTSVSGDRIIIGGGLTSSNRQVSDWDTLTEKHDSPLLGPGKVALGEGNGGDNSTIVTNTTFTRPNFASIVLLQAASSGIHTNAMHHYRNHGRIF